MKKLVVLSLIVLSWSCDKVLFEEDLATTDPYENFDYLWTQADEKYSFFDVKGVDWDQVYTDYRALLYDGMSDDSLFRVLGGMLTHLRDDHTNLSSDFNISYYGIRNRTPDNYDPRIVQDNYLPLDHYVSGPFIHDFINGTNIGYIRFSAFTGTVDDTNLNFMLERYKDTDGLIFDIRENGGGAVTDVFNILSRFIDTKTHTYNSRIKTGPGHNDFSPWEEVEVEPSDEIRYTDHPVVFLIDRGTFSAGSYTTVQTKAISNIVLMGDTTGGGLGLPNGGQLPNGWKYRFSVTQSAPVSDPENPMWEQGIPPDIQVSLDRSDLTTDEIIEAAIANINSRQ